jgi:hypothetical protein
MNLSRNSGRFGSPGISADASAFDQDSGLSVIGNSEALLEISYTPEICPVDATTDLQYLEPWGHVPDDSVSRAIKKCDGGGSSYDDQLLIPTTVPRR